MKKSTLICFILGLCYTISFAQDINYQIGIGYNKLNYYAGNWLLDIYSEILASEQITYGFGASLGIEQLATGQGVTLVDQSSGTSETLTKLIPMSVYGSVQYYLDGHTQTGPFIGAGFALASFLNNGFSTHLEGTEYNLLAGWRLPLNYESRADLIVRYHNGSGYRGLLNGQTAELTGGTEWLNTWDMMVRFVYDFGTEQNSTSLDFYSDLVKEMTKSSNDGIDGFVDVSIAEPKFGEYIDISSTAPANGQGGNRKFDDTFNFWMPRYMSMGRDYDTSFRALEGEQVKTAYLSIGENQRVNYMEKNDGLWYAVVDPAKLKSGEQKALVSVTLLDGQVYQKAFDVIIEKE